MSDITAPTRFTPSAARTPPLLTTGPIGWLRANLFSSWLSTAVTLLLGYLLVRWAMGFVDWAFVKAIWSVETGADGRPLTQPCRVNREGACWAVVTENHRFILFGLYPYDEQWRPLVACILFVGLYIVSAMRRFWRKELALIWAVTLTVIGILMWGGVFGLTFVDQERWGGLPITLILSTFGLAFAFPLAILVALGRRSNLPAVKIICVLYVELIRGVPLISLLFMASVMFPLFLPEGVTVDKILRAQVAIILFTAAYIAEVVRGGLQAIPRGQYEAAESLGLDYYLKMRLIILPQALKIVIPPTVSILISAFKDTSLVVIIGLFDLLKTTQVTLSNPEWMGFSAEAYLFVAMLYFAGCFSMSNFSRRLERELHS